MKVSLNLLKFPYHNPRMIRSKNADASNYSASKNTNYDFVYNYNNLINFSGSKYRLLELEGLSCPICEQIMLTSSQINDFMKEISDLTGKELKTALEKYEDDRNISENGTGKSIYRSQEQKIVNILKSMTEEFPDANLQRLVKIKAKELNNKLLNKMPIGVSEEIRHWFAHLSSEKLSSRQITERLVHNSKISTEHIVPKAKNGKNTNSNYLCDCVRCNSNRGSMDFGEWIKQYPHFEENMEQQFKLIEEAIKQGKLSDDYYKKIRKAYKTIHKASNREIKINVLEDAGLETSTLQWNEKLRERESKIEALRLAQIEHKAKLQQNLEEIKRCECVLSALKMEESGNSNATNKDNIKNKEYKQAEELKNKRRHLKKIVAKNNVILSHLLAYKKMTDVEFEKLVEGFTFL